MRGFVYFLFCLGSFCSISQPTLGGSVGTAYDMNTALGGFISEVDLTNYSPVGSSYLFDEWKVFDIKLKDGAQFKDVELKVNLGENVVEFKQLDVIKTFSLSRVGSLSMDQAFDSTTYYHPSSFEFYNDNPLIGLFRIVDDSEKWKLLERSFGKVIKANYIPELDAGYKHDRYLTEKAYYLQSNEKIYEITGSRKAFAKSLGLTDIGFKSFTKYLKKSGIDFDDIVDLREMVYHLNSKY